MEPIERKATLETFGKLKGTGYDDAGRLLILYTDAVEAIMNQPVIQQERAAQKVNDPDFESIYCNICGSGMVDKPDNYCWYCGAKFTIQEEQQ